MPTLLAKNSRRSPKQKAVRPAAGKTKTAAPIADWVALAKELAAEFRKTVVEREWNDIRPLAEIERLRETRVVNLLIPRAHGGEGGTLGDAARVVREISKADASLGFLLGLHYNHLLTPRQVDPASAERFERPSAEERWFWGNVLGPFHISGEPTADGGLIAFGTKHMCSGAALGNVLKVMGKWTDRDEMFFAALPSDRAGIRFHRDWDALGLRASETHSVTLDRVVVRPEEVIRGPKPLTGFAPFASAGLFSSALHIGILTGALEETREYLGKTPSNPRSQGGNFDLPIQDPFIQLEFGKVWIQLQAVEALFEQQIRESESLWNRREQGIPIDPKEQADVGRRGTALQLHSGNLALEFTAKIFELAGGRSLGRSHGLDRFWRDIRSHTVHHPQSYTVKNIGEWALGGSPQKPSFFVTRKNYEERKAAAKAQAEIRS